jgi:hypothetical protein
MSGSRSGISSTAIQTGRGPGIRGVPAALPIRSCRCFRQSPRAGRSTSSASGLAIAGNGRSTWKTSTAGATTSPTTPSQAGAIAVGSPPRRSCRRGRSLPEKIRRPLLLAAEGKTCVEIGRVVGVVPSTAWKRANKAKATVLTSLQVRAR